MKKEKIRIALVNDHQIVVDGLLSLLQDEPALDIVLTGNRHDELIQLLSLTTVDILLTDITHSRSFNWLKSVQQRFPWIRIVALTLDNEDHLAFRMAAHADIPAYVLKYNGKRNLIASLHNIAGQVGWQSTAETEPVAVETSGRPIPNMLTGRELEIIRLIEQEHSNRQIAETLFISERTVETHRKNILRKTGTNSVIGLIKYAYHHNLV